MNFSRKSGIAESPSVKITFWLAILSLLTAGVYEGYWITLLCVSAGAFLFLLGYLCGFANGGWPTKF